MSQATPSTNGSAPIPLWDMAEGEVAEIASFSSDLADEFRRRLQEVGFLPGGEVSCVLATELGAPRLYSIYNSVFSLDHAIAEHVHVNVRGQ